MSEKLYGICENKCLVEVAPKKETIVRDNFVTITGIITLEANTSEKIAENTSKFTYKTLPYPEGFNRDNCVVIAFGSVDSEAIEGNYNKGFCFGQVDSGNYVSGMANGGNPKIASVRAEDIMIGIGNFATSNKTHYYKITLMKTPVYEEGEDYILGDVNGDGAITQEDAELVQSYIMEEISLTDKQFKAADVNRDGKIKATDKMLIQNYANGIIDHF